MPDVSRRDRQEAAGIDVARVGDEHETLAIVDTGAREPAAALAPLRYVSAVVLCLGGLDVERGGLRGPVQKLENLLVLLCCQVVVNNRVRSKEPATRRKPS
jgi:hypothetical protein